MPNYRLIRRFEDEREELSDIDLPLGSGIEVGRKLPLDDGEWTIVDVREGSPVTLVVERR